MNNVCLKLSYKYFKKTHPLKLRFFWLKVINIQEKVQPIPTMLFKMLWSRVAHYTLHLRTKTKCSQEFYFYELSKYI